MRCINGKKVVLWKISNIIITKKLNTNMATADAMVIVILTSTTMSTTMKIITTNITITSIICASRLSRLLLRWSC